MGGAASQGASRLCSHAASGEASTQRLWLPPAPMSGAQAPLQPSRRSPAAQRLPPARPGAGARRERGRGPHAGPLRGGLGRQPPRVSLPPACHCHPARPPAEPRWFSRPEVVGSPLPGTRPRAREPGVRRDPSLLGGGQGALQPREPRILFATRGRRTPRRHVSPPPTVLRWPVIRGDLAVPPGLGGLGVVVALYFCSDFAVVAREAGTASAFYAILTDLPETEPLLILLYSPKQKQSWPHMTRNVDFTEL